MLGKKTTVFIVRFFDKRILLEEVRSCNDIRIGKIFQDNELNAQIGI